MRVQCEGKSLFFVIIFAGLLFLAFVERMTRVSGNKNMVKIKKTK